MTGPLTGVKVVDFSAVVSGPFAAMWLADQGADVVKVENLKSPDITRGPGSPDLKGLAGLFVNCNRGKRGLSVDVTHREGRDLVLALCRQADVFVQNWRPGVVERLGLSYDDVAAINPSIVYVSISGYGPDGPYANRRVYDPIIQGLTGHVAVQVNPEIPFPDLVRTIVCDKATALTAAQSICAALFARERGAGGQHIVIPMLDVGLSFFFPDGFMAKALLDDAEADERLTLAKVYSLQRTADGHVTLYCASEKEYSALFRALGHPEWTDDPRFAADADRRANFAELSTLIVDAFASWNTAELVPRLEAEEVPFGPILGLDELQHDVQILHNNALGVRVHPVAGRVLEPRPPVRFGTIPAAPGRLAPQVGEHNDELLAELGHSPADIARLRESGVIG